ncbi:MAG: hypothetical protein ACRCW0_08985 [Clostridium sp.]
MKEIYDKMQEVLEDEGIVFDSDFDGSMSALVTKSYAIKTEIEMKSRLDSSIAILYDNVNDDEGYHYYIIYGERLKELYECDPYYIGKKIAAQKYKL